MAGLELVCGALIFVGLASRLTAVPIIAIMAVAIATAKRDGYLPAELACDVRQVVAHVLG